MALQIQGIYVNLPVQDLQKSREFFETIGIRIDEDFSDDRSCCLVLGNNLYAMLLVKPFFESFTQQKVADTEKVNEVILAVTVQDTHEVDHIKTIWLQAGGKDVTTPLRPEEAEFLYYYRLEDLDGHLWEITYMKPWK